MRRITGKPPGIFFITVCGFGDFARKCTGTFGSSALIVIISKHKKKNKIKITKEMWKNGNNDVVCMLQIADDQILMVEDYDYMEYITQIITYD